MYSLGKSLNINKSYNSIIKPNHKNEFLKEKLTVKESVAIRNSGGGRDGQVEHRIWGAVKLFSMIL